MPRPLPLQLAVGDQLGLFTVVEGPCQRERNGARRTMVKVECQVCGREKWHLVAELLRASCYCNTERHGHARKRDRHPLYTVWTNLTQRCTNPNHPQYPDYGGRGIQVCDEWRDAAQFLVWAGSAGWEPGLQIDRRDNDGDYEPSNCRFVTPSVNASNRRPKQKGS
jgi:hypothetical protein